MEARAALDRRAPHTGVQILSDLGILKMVRGILTVPAADPQSGHLACVKKVGLGRVDFQVLRRTQASLDTKKNWIRRWLQIKEGMRSGSPLIRILKAILKPSRSSHKT